MDVLPFVAKQILMEVSLAMGFTPIAQTKSGDIASSSEPESKQTNASMLFTLRMAVGQRPIQTFG
jgi:hypothetical protein